jgi:hypothetical protein
MGSTYKLIIKNLLHTDNNIFSSNYDKNETVDERCKLFFNIFLKQNIDIKNKFNFFYETINSIFLKDKKEKFINYFCKVQKTYNALNKCLLIYKFKKSKTVVNTDMALNEININEKNIICLFQDDVKYLFNINDLINIINSSLTNNYLFFSEPLCVKNPYNNLPFSKSTLYNIYLFIKFKTHILPILFFNFFYCDFNLECFKIKYEYLLRQYTIENYVYKSPSNILVKEIKKMIYSFNNNCIRCKLKNRILIDENFPSDKLIKIMRPYLLIYIHSLFSLLPYKKIEMKNMLKILLIRFNKFNPQFGRRKYKIIMGYTKNFKRRIIGKIIEYDDRFIPFNNVEKQNENFLQDHLGYKSTINIFTQELIFIDNSNDESSIENDMEEGEEGGNELDEVDNDEGEEENEEYNDFDETDSVS